TPLLQFYTNPDFTNERVLIYVCRDIQRISTSSSETKNVITTAVSPASLKKNLLENVYFDAKTSEFVFFFNFKCKVIGLEHFVLQRGITSLEQQIIGKKYRMSVVMFLVIFNVVFWMFVLK